MTDIIETVQIPEVNLPVEHQLALTVIGALASFAATMLVGKGYKSVYEHVKHVKIKD
jgi:hypothetical protein